MSKLLLQTLLLTICFVHFDCQYNEDQPKIITRDGHLIFESAENKNIYLNAQGPGASVFVGDINLRNLTNVARSTELEPTIEDIEKYMSGPNGILRRLERLESHVLETPSDLLFNISILWRRINRQTNIISTLRNQINERGRDHCQPQPCRNGGTCLNLVTGYHCLCPSNWEGQDCDLDVNECRNFAGTDLGCQNGATCINRPGSYECICRHGWFGLHCNRKNKDCSAGDYEMCGHGVCVPISTREGITCICDQGWTTNGTDVACLTDVNECESSQGPRCSINPRVECINLPGSFRCGQCPAGYEGDGFTCSDIDECLTVTNGGCSTSPLVPCYNTIGSRICGTCPPGFQGDGVTCTWRGSCSINRGGCHPSAQCVDNPSLGGLMAQCICPVGMDGDGVGINGCYISNSSSGCENNPCGIHGQCHPLRNRYTCICFRGFGGAHCDITADYCSSNPCLHGGVCRPDENAVRGFRCECTAQYSGDRCHIVVKTCGGFMQAEEGNIIYPLSNKTYNHNSRCAWVIQTVANKVINVTFSKFNLEANPECLYDFLQIHDGRSSASQIIGRFCGNEFPKGGNIISTHNKLYFWFRSDQTVAMDGFALHWTSIDPVCGGEINATSHGHISSPGSPGKYPENRDCYWHLQTSLGKRIQLHFFALDIESHENCSYDYIAIYDGSKTTDPLMNMFCNSTQPAPIESASSDILIHFHSDAYSSGYGFQIAFSPTDGVPGCGGYFTKDSGEISSPSYEGKYLPNLLCEYKIRTSPDTKVRISFKQFKLEKSNKCRYDYLKIYDGPSSESRLVGKFCGTTFPKSYTSSSNTLYLKFMSDYGLTADGFKIAYESVCHHTILGDSGIIKSPSYPFNYPANRKCEYIIGSSPGKSIQLTFQDFDIERTDNCEYDYVEIRDGPTINSTFLGRYCGRSEQIPPVTTSTHNYMYIKFNSDLSASGTGFYANFTTIDTKCGGIFRETTGVINYPSETGTDYEKDQTCTWILLAPEGMHIKLTWNRFATENMPSCNSDYLELIEIDDFNENSVIGKYCGITSPPALTISSHRLMLKFVSDSSVQSKGFSVSYTFLDAKSHCGGLFAKSHGYIYSPGWPKRYESGRECTWTIMSPVGQQIKLNISQFDLERPIQNKCDLGDYLEIRNGISSDSPLIGKFCGQFNTKYVVSLSNSLYLRFHSDSYITGNGFKIEWDSTITGCGGTLSSPSGSISSPNYPSNYHDNSECFYRIATSVGSRLQLIFKDLDLERTVKCRDDYVEIFDGKNTDAPSLGKYCNMEPKLRGIETTSNYAFIKFRSDFYISGKGFILDYTTICRNNLTGLHGAIESPGYPDSYASPLDCMWTIIVPKGNFINLTFIHLDIFLNRYSFHYLPYRISEGPGDSRRLSIRRPTECSLDYLQIKETSEIGYNNKMCGTTIPAKISSKTNSIQIKFVANSFYGNKGFSLEWVRQGCGGHIQKEIGELSLSKDHTTGSDIECEWLIETPIGTSISFTISELYMSESSNCTIDAIEVYNGETKNSPLLLNVCHQGSYKTQTNSNFMLVKFSKRSSMKDVYFKALFNSYGSICGGMIGGHSGFINSKNYPKNYDNDLNCIWTIVVPNNHRIELNFMEFDLYSGPTENGPDCDDYINVYEGLYYAGKNFTQRICPRNSQIPTVLSKSNVLGIQFITDDYNTAKGFKANYTMICGATITANHDGVLSNNDIPSHFSRNCTWTIISPKPGQKISLTITHINIPRDIAILSDRHCPSSFLKVFDGDDENAPLVDEYCGRKAPPIIVSHGSAITLQLGSYYNNSKLGQFSAHYTTIDSACGGTLFSEEGIIASPNYPQSYPISANCEWILRTSPGNRVYVTFEQFSLDYSDNCNKDYLEIRQNNGAGNLLGLYCGQEIPGNTTIASRLYIKFHSDNDNGGGRGFMINYGFLHGNDIAGEDSGQITSPMYPNRYQGSGEYNWRIVVDDTHTITLRIQDLEIPSQETNCYNTLSIYDGYDQEAPLFGEYCGLLNEKELKTTSNAVYIKLKLDETNTGSLFSINWAKDDKNIDQDDGINCGINETKLVLPGKSITFESANFPEEYEDNLNCEWMFNTLAGYHLSLSFSRFEIEETPHCFADFVSIYTSDSLMYWQPVKENICLRKDLETSFNASTYLKVNFKTDSSITRAGFQGKIRALCGGVVSDLSGTIGPVWGDTEDIYHRLRFKCEWTIKVRPGRNINLQFEYFNITNTNNLCETSVTIRNGDSVASPFLGLGKYCGSSHENTGELMESTGNIVHVSFTRHTTLHTSNSFYNFKLRYEEKHNNCGATSKLDFYKKWEVISSPNYPSVPSPYSECIWTFTGPPGEILRIDFMERFDLDRSEDCSQEIVEVRDGLTEYSKILGRFCKDKPGTIKATGNRIFIKYSTLLPEPRNGFKANVSLDVCGGTIIASKGELLSPGYPHMTTLPLGTTCVWHIIGPKQQVLKIKPIEISMPESEATCGTSITIEELMPANNTVTRLFKQCSDAEDDIDNTKVIETSTNEVTVTFSIGKSSHWARMENRGFKFMFNSSRQTCGGTISTPEGYFSTPGYPRATSYRYCQWHITVPDKTRRIRLELLDYDIQKHRIGMYNDFGFQSEIDNLRQGHNAADNIFESSGSELVIFVWSEVLETLHKFKAKFTSNEPALCGGTLNGVTGELDSPVLDKPYACGWHFGNQIQNVDNNITNFNSIYVTASVNSTLRMPRRHCGFSDSKVTIKAPVSSTVGTFLRNICGEKEVNFRIPSTTFDLKAVQSKQHSLEFHLRWKLQPCGGTIKAGGNSRNILEIPRNYNETIECAWFIEAAFDSKIELKLEGAFTYECNEEYIQITLGVYDTEATVADYCKDKTQEAPLVMSFRSMIVQYHSKPKNSTDIKLFVKTDVNQCGGQLGKFDNVFSSPNFPLGYQSNMECVWELTADLGNRISIEFIDRFFIENHENCTKDVLIIYDWKDGDYVEKVRLCGRKLPPKFVSTANRMKVLLRTDADVNSDGFKIIWQQVCGGNFTAMEKEQIIYSPGYPFSYKPLLDCTYEITGERNIIIKFDDFELEGTYPDCEYDNVTLTAFARQGYIEWSKIYCGYELPLVVNKYNKVTIQFKTDQFILRKGFKMSYRINECGGLVKEPTTISPGSLDGYDDNLNCTWSIQAPVDKRVILKLEYIDLENHYECGTDYLAVYDSLLINIDKRLAVFCGKINSTTILVSTNNTMSLQFVTDYSFSFTGFKAAVSFSYSDKVGCGGNIDLSSVTATHTLKSPLIGSNVVYENFLDCLWNIEVPKDYVVKIEFTSFHIAPCEGVNQTALGISNCKCDLVEIRDGINPNSLTIGRYCGHTKPPTLSSSSNLMSIWFATDGEISSSGFTATLSVQRSICGQTLYTVSDKVTHLVTPKYSTGSIPRGLHCSYYFDIGDHIYTPIRLTIKKIDLQAGVPNENTCNRDKLIITRTAALVNRTLGQDYIINGVRDSFFSNEYFDETSLQRPERYVLCGKMNSIDYYLMTAATLSLSVQTYPEEDSKTYGGAEIEITFIGVCGRNYTEPQGRIKNNYVNIVNEPFSDCYTLITASESHTISLYFLSISAFMADDNYYLDIHDGNSTSSSKLVRFSDGYEENFPVFSTGRYILLHDHAAGDSTHVVYDLNYVTSTKGRGCGGKLSNVIGKVTSPLYPSVYRQRGSCEWEIETPAETRVRLHFSVFDLGRVCDQNYVQLVDRSGAILSNYCEEIPADYTSNDNYVKIVFVTTMNNGGTGWVAEFISVV